MLKFTRNSVIAFDFKDALSFEGETGPYIQYAVVRARNIFRKGGTTPEAVFARVRSAGGVLGSYLDGEENEDIWALWLRAGAAHAGAGAVHRNLGAGAIWPSMPSSWRRSSTTSTTATTSSPKRTPARKTFLLATAAVALRELVIALEWLGIESPEAM